MGTIGIVLAAGQGKRMGNPSLPKVLVPLAGKPLLAYVLDTLSSLWLERIISIVGFARQQVIAYLHDHYPAVEYAVQHEQRGTAHAVLHAAPLLQSWHGTLLIVNGDVPLVQSQTLSDFLSYHAQSDAALSILTTTVPNPNGYGRILRSGDGTVDAIVEDADLLPHQRTIDEINTGIYAADAKTLFGALSQTTTSNAQGEYYLTDAVAILRESGKRVCAWVHPDWQQFLGVNTPDQLQLLEHYVARTYQTEKSI